jgi:uncharacterized protein (DUF983 family)
MARRSTIISRALRLRCPNCGGGGVFRRWVQMAQDCPTCGYALASGNRVGANLLNLVASEVTLFIAMGVIIVRSWPNPPWTFLQYGAPLLMALAPLVLYPFSKMLFIAFDLAMHPEAMPDPKVHGVGGG